MFEKYYDKYEQSSTERLPKRRIKQIKAEVLKLARRDAGAKRYRLKPVLIAAAVASTCAASLVTVNAATGGALVKFVLDGEELCGYYNSYVDSEGYRRIEFSAEMPIDADNYAIITDVDAESDNVRMLTDITVDEVESMEFSDSETCWYSFTDVPVLLENGETAIGRVGGIRGGEFKRIGAAKGMPSGESKGFSYDFEKGVKYFKGSIYYYVGIPSETDGTEPQSRGAETAKTIETAPPDDETTVGQPQPVTAQEQTGSVAAAESTAG